MPISVDELNTILFQSKQAKFINTNLHVHTPATPYDWDCQLDQTLSSKEVTPEIFFSALNKTSLELVAITDHNTMEWCEPLMKLAIDARSKKESRLHVLPGFELTSYEGPHLIGIFPEDLELLPRLKTFLLTLGLSGNGLQGERISQGDPSDAKTLVKIIQKIVELGGIPIAPHIGTSAGIWGHKEFGARHDVLNCENLHILSANSGEIKVIPNGKSYKLLYKNMPIDDYRRTYAFINSSDCHRLDDLEKNSTWIKMGEPTLEGVRQIIYEPKLRVCHRVIESGKNHEFPLSFEFTDPEEDEHPHILGMVISGGVMDGQKLSFSPNQNCVIGKNYAGKSFILDCIRFVTETEFDANSESYKKHCSRLENLLGIGNDVRVYIKKNGKTYAFSRTLLVSGSSKEKKLEGSTDVYELIEGEFLRQSQLSARTIFPLEVYAQGEVVKIKDNVVKQMDLLNALADVEQDVYELTTCSEGKESILKSLRSNGQEIIQLSLSLESEGPSTTEIDKLSSEIAELEILASSPVFDELKKWGDCEAKLQKVINKLNSIDSIRGKLEESLDEYLKDEPEYILENSEVKNPMRLLHKASHLFTDYINNLQRAIGQRALLACREEITLLAEEARSVYDQVKSENATSTSGTSKAQITELLAQKRISLQELDTKNANRIKKQNRINELEAIRAQLLLEYENAWKKVRDKRSAVVGIINNNTGGIVRAELVEDQDRTVCKQTLSDITGRLSSSSNRISNREEQLNLIIDSISPTELIKLVRNGDAQAIVDKSKVTINTARILVGMGVADIHELELNGLRDRFIIGYKKEGDEVFTPIDGSLSGGEQALALLSVALVPKNRPLLIDQPEDELGTALITNDLVNQIRQVKHKRQLIFVTHIANIPVLSDSENIVYIENKSKSIRARYDGSLEKPEIVSKLIDMDGGPEAFKKRNERYSSVFKDKQERH